MWIYALVYGSISGLIAIGVIIGGNVWSDGQGRGSSQVFGYLVMLLALTLIFFAVRRYRDGVQGGVIGFGRALLLGALISLVASFIYAAVWEIYFVINGFDFFDTYATSVIEKKKAAGVAGEALAQEIAKMAALKEKYANIFFRFPVTMSEILPVGLLVSFVSAAFLRTGGFFGGFKKRRKKSLGQK